jgi:hypothetical protein
MNRQSQLKERIAQMNGKINLKEKLKPYTAKVPIPLITKIDKYWQINPKLAESDWDGDIGDDDNVEEDDRDGSDELRDRALDWAMMEQHKNAERDLGAR